MVSEEAPVHATSRFVRHVASLFLRDSRTRATYLASPCAEEPVSVSVLVVAAPIRSCVGGGDDDAGTNETVASASTRRGVAIASCHLTARNTLPRAGTDLAEVTCSATLGFFASA